MTVREAVVSILGEDLADPTPMPAELIQKAEAGENIYFNAEQVRNKEHEQLNPDRFDFHWNEDYTECTAIPLKWWNESSYEDYQYGCGSNDE